MDGEPITARMIAETHSQETVRVRLTVFIYISGVSGRHVRYRVHTRENGWLAWVTDYGEGSNGYAGVYGHAIDAVQIEVV